MADRISSDHPSVTTIRATLAPTATGVRVEVPPDERDAFPAGDVVRVVCDGSERFARVERSLTADGLSIPGVYDSPSHARSPGDGPDRLPAWVDDHGIRTGGSVLVDVVEPDFLYGLRAPGEDAYYDAREPPSESLASIAKNLETSIEDEER